MQGVGGVTYTSIDSLHKVTVFSLANRSVNNLKSTDESSKDLYPILRHTNETMDTTAASVWTNATTSEPPTEDE